MIDSVFHVSIDGIKFRLAEDAEGEHYNFRQEPTRLQTAAVVQGTNRGNPTFQIRPDLLLWEMSDWSGGEGQLKFDPDQPSRYQESRNVDAISEPGKLRLAYTWQRTADSTGGADFIKDVSLVRARGKLMAVDRNADDVYVWDEINKRWGAVIDNPLIAADAGGAAIRASGTAKYLWYYDVVTDKVYQWDETTFVAWTAALTVGHLLIRQGDYLYLWRWDNSSTREIAIAEAPATGTPPLAWTEVYRTKKGHLGGYQNASLITTGDNDFYFLEVTGTETVVHKVVPSTAAGPAYGRPIARLPGLYGNAIWYHMGLIFVAGKETATASDNAANKILYIRDGGEFGAVGELDIGELVPTDKMIVAHDAADFINSYFLAEVQPVEGRDWTLYAVNAIEGNLFGLTRVNMNLNHQPETLVKHRGDWFFAGGATDAAITPAVYRIIGGSFTVDEGYVVSPVHDFGMADQKLLLSIRLICEPLPSNCLISVEYQIDQSGVWTSAGSLSTDNATSEEFIISTDSTNRQFRNLQLRVKLDNTNDTTQTPKLLSVQAKAAVVEFIDVWDLLLDVSDELAQVQNRSWSGTTLIDKLRVAARKEKLVSFKNGYEDPRPDEFDEFDVVVDGVSMVLDRPAEGVAAVTLKVMR